MNPAHYAKYIAAVLGVVLAAVAAALADGAITIDEAVNLAVVTLGAISTSIVRNLPTGIGHYAKTIVGALTAGAVLLASLTTDGITLSEWLMVGAAIITAYTTYLIPNAPAHSAPPVPVLNYAAAHPANSGDHGDDASRAFPTASA